MSRAPAFRFLRVRASSGEPRSMIRIAGRRNNGRRRRALARRRIGFRRTIGILPRRPGVLLHAHDLVDELADRLDAMLHILIGGAFDVDASVAVSEAEMRAVIVHGAASQGRMTHPARMRTHPAALFTPVVLPVRRLPVLITIPATILVVGPVRVGLRLTPGATTRLVVWLCQRRLRRTDDRSECHRWSQ